MSYGDDSYGDQRYRGNYGASGPDFSDLAGHAERQHGSASSYFNEAANHLQQNHGAFQNQDFDEGHAVQSHQKLYGGGGGGPADSSELGAGAAIQALKKFTGGSGGGSGSPNELIGLAMSEAEKLFDQHSANGNASGDKQSAINSAAEMAFKMYAKSQGSGLGGTGGPAGLMSLASKFF